MAATTTTTPITRPFGDPDSCPAGGGASHRIVNNRCDACGDDDPSPFSTEDVGTLATRATADGDYALLYHLELTVCSTMAGRRSPLAAQLAAALSILERRS